MRTSSQDTTTEQTQEPEQQQEPEQEQPQEPQSEPEQEQLQEQPQEPEQEQQQEPEPEPEQEQPQEPEPEQQHEQTQEPELQELEPPELQPPELQPPEIAPSEPEPQPEQEQTQDQIPDPIIETVPKIVFIVPYRDREQQYKFFSKHMQMILEDMHPNDYKIYYIHQCDKREFNRGAMKNIGFIMLKEKYSNDYKDITLVFNDIDIMPFSKNFLDYNTVSGNVKHFYGFEYTLGGIVSIKASDFEKVNGFPNFWAWGYEDNLLQKRIQNARINIDRSHFYHILDKNILLLHDGVTRTVNKHEFNRYMNLTSEGIHSIRNLNYNILDNGFVNVSTFDTEVDPVSTENREYDIRNGPRPFGNPIIKKRKGAMGMHLFQIWKQCIKIITHENMGIHSQ